MNKKMKSIILNLILSVLCVSCDLNELNYEKMLNERLANVNYRLSEMSRVSDLARAGSGGNPETVNGNNLLHQNYNVHENLGLNVNNVNSNLNENSGLNVKPNLGKLKKPTFYHFEGKHRKGTYFGFFIPFDSPLNNNNINTNLNINGNTGTQLPENIELNLHQTIKDNLDCQMENNEYKIMNNNYQSNAYANEEKKSESAEQSKYDVIKFKGENNVNLNLNNYNEEREKYIQNLMHLLKTSGNPAEKIDEKKEENNNNYNVNSYSQNYNPSYDYSEKSEIESKKIKVNPVEEKKLSEKIYPQLPQQVQQPQMVNYDQEKSGNNNEEKQEQIDWNNILQLMKEQQQQQQQQQQQSSNINENSNGNNNNYNQNNENYNTNFNQYSSENNGYSTNYKQQQPKPYTPSSSSYQPSHIATSTSSPIENEQQKSQNQEEKKQENPSNSEKLGSPSSTFFLATSPPSDLISSVYSKYKYNLQNLNSPLYLSPNYQVNQMGHLSDLSGLSRIESGMKSGLAYASSPALLVAPGFPKITQNIGELGSPSTPKVSYLSSDFTGLRSGLRGLSEIKKPEPILFYSLPTTSASQLRASLFPHQSFSLFSNPIYLKHYQKKK